MHDAAFGSFVRPSPLSQTAMAEPAQKKARTARTFLFSSESVNEGAKLGLLQGNVGTCSDSLKQLMRSPRQDLRPGVGCCAGRLPEGGPQEQGGLRDGDQGLLELNMAEGTHCFTTWDMSIKS